MFLTDQLTCRFGLFVNGSPSWNMSHEDLNGLFSEIPGDVDRVKLRSPSTSIRLVSTPNGVVPHNAVEYPGSMWSLNILPNRIELVADLQTYMEFNRSSDIELHSFAEVASESLNALVGASETEVSVSRLTLIVEGILAGVENQSLWVADRFFGPSIQETAKCGDVLDIVGKVNNVERGWGIKCGGEDVDVYKIEVAHADWGLVHDKPETVLRWQLDINTSPVGMKGRVFDNEAIVRFFSKASRYGSSMINSLGAQSC